MVLLGHPHRHHRGDTGSSMNHTHPARPAPTSAVRGEASLADW